MFYLTSLGQSNESNSIHLAYHRKRCGSLLDVRYAASDAESNNLTDTEPTQPGVGSACFSLKEVPIEQMDETAQALIYFYETVKKVIGGKESNET